MIVFFADKRCCSLGGRFKKEVVLDGQSYLLLIRDEGGLPEMQVLFQHSVVGLRLVLVALCTVYT